MAGLTIEGLEIKTLDEIKTELGEAIKAVFGNHVNTTDQSNFGQLIGIFAEREALLWELLQSVYFSQYPDTASGINLDNVASITGITRQAATNSLQRDLLLFGNVGVTVPSGTQVSVDGDSTAVFETLSTVVLVAGTDEIQDIDFSAVPDNGNWRLGYRDEQTSLLAFNASNTDVENALNALDKLSGVTVVGDYTAGFTVTFAGDDGKQDQPILEVLDNTLLIVAVPIVVSFTETVTGVPQGLTNAQAVDTGPVVANAFALTVIDTPIGGLDRVLNTIDAEVGSDIESDAELRIRRNETLERAGAGTVEAIRARLLDLENVTDVIVFENVTDLTNVDGLPPHSFETIVGGGDEQEIADLIWIVKPAGIATHGVISKSVEDSMGFTKTIKFSRPTTIETYVDLTITKDLSGFPATGADLAEQAVIDHINGLGIGNDVIVYPGLIASLNDIPGIIDITVLIDDAPAPATDDNVIIDINEIAHLDSLNISVTVI